MINDNIVILPNSNDHIVLNNCNSNDDKLHHRYYGYAIYTVTIYFKMQLLTSKICPPKCITAVIYSTVIIHCIASIQISLFKLYYDM